MSYAVPRPDKQKVYTGATSTEPPPAKMPTGQCADEGAKEDKASTPSGEAAGQP